MTSNDEDRKKAEEWRDDLDGEVISLGSILKQAEGEAWSPEWQAARRKIHAFIERSYLAGLEEGRKSQWVKCSERMPEEYTNVLVAGREPGHLASIATYIFEDEKRKWCQREKEVTVLSSDCWMHLPPPPAEDKS